MSPGMVVIRNGLLALAVATAVAGCRYEESAPPGVASRRIPAAERLVERDGLATHNVLRVRKDAQRNRLWVLTIDDVRVYDLTDERAPLMGRILLPNWSVVRELCEPDMVLDGTGSAFIVSNVNPRLWLIDGDNFALSEREVRLHQKEHWDTGFRALLFAADGTLIAWTSAGDSLWKIDPATASAHRIDLASPPAATCGFPAQWLDRLERNLQP